MNPNSKLRFIKVTSTSYYIIEGNPHNYGCETVEQILEEWFVKYPLDFNHAAREAAKVGYSDRLVKYEEVTKDEYVKQLRDKLKRRLI